MAIGLRASLGLGLLMLVAACTAAATEETSKSSAAAETTGFTCSTKMKLPTQLPDVTTCINDTDGNGGTDGCNGWTKAGPFQLGNDELRSVAKAGAQLYEIKPDDSTLCLYLYRGDAKVSAGSLNGVHCYNTSTCDLCWWDGATGAGVKPTADILKHESSDNCSDCHRNGPLLPKSSLWTAASDDTIDLHQVCSGAGGPTWADPVSGWTFASPDKTTIVKSPGGCGSNSCHNNGFSSGPAYCQMITHSFGDANGSMRSEGKKFKSADDCTSFLTSMGCDTNIIDCTDTAISGAASSPSADDDDDTVSPDGTNPDDADTTNNPDETNTDDTGTAPAGDDDDDGTDAGADDSNAHSRKKKLHSAFNH